MLHQALTTKIGQCAYGLLGMAQAHYIKSWRLYRHLTQQQVAERVGLDKSVVSKVENHHIRYTQETLEAFAQAFDCQVGDLFSAPPNELDLFRQAVRAAQQNGTPEQLETVAKVINAMVKTAA